MGALFGDGAVLQYEDGVRVLDGGQAVGDDKAGAPFHELVHGLLDLDLGTRVHIGGGLVQNKHGRVAEHGPGDGDDLALTLGDVNAVIREHGIVPVGQALDVGVDACGFGGGDHFVPGGVFSSVGDVVKHRAMEQPCVLQHHGVRPTQRGSRQLAQLVSVHADETVVHIVKAHE